MGTPDTNIAVAELIERIGTPSAPRLFDVRRRKLFDSEERVVATAKWRDHREAETWARELPPGAEVVVYCAHGHNVSAAAAALLREAGLAARMLDGGIEAWVAADGPTLRRDRLPAPLMETPGRWLTGLSPRPESLACLWLIRRWIDPDGRVLRLAEDWIAPTVEDLGGLSFAVPGEARADVAGMAEHFDLALDGLERLAGPAFDGAATLAARGLAGPEHGLAVLDGLFAAGRWERAS